MFKLNTTDRQLIDLLQENARQSSSTLARKLKVSSATVRRRVRQLIQAGVIRIVALPDPEKLGFSLTVALALNVEHQGLKAVIQSLAQRPEVHWVSTTTGRFDVIALARFLTKEDLRTFVEQVIPKIEGVKDSETFLCLGQTTKAVPTTQVNPAPRKRKKALAKSHAKTS